MSAAQVTASDSKFNSSFHQLIFPAHTELIDRSISIWGSLNLLRWN